MVGLQLIGSGGSGLIYKGRQEALSRDVAVKVLASPPVEPESLARWKREVDAMGRLSNHPNIVAIYDSGLDDDGRPYLVMPFIPGGSLGDRVRASGPLDADEALVLGRKIATALSAAHEAGVLHRDVKPDNVLLSPYEPQLADFGIARMVDATTTAVTAAGMLHATINYAAPEVLTGEPASEASDVYGLAATLFTALSRDVPFPHAPDVNAIALAHQIVHNPVPSLPTTVPREVADVIAQGMAKDPRDRPSSAAAFGAALASALRAATPEPTTTATAPVRTTVQALPRIAQRPRAEVAPTRGPSRHGRAVIAAVAVLAGVVAVLLFARSQDEGSRAPANTSPTTVGPSAGKTATTGRAAASASTSGVAAAARQYFTRLSRGDYGGAYAMLSPAFKAAQSQASFEGFWRGASPVSITGDVSASGLTARIPVRMGSRASTYVLQFARSGDALYVDGPRPR